MKWKQIAIYFLVLVAVAGYYFFETAHKKAIKEKEIESKKILNIKKGEIAAIKIVRRGDKTFYIEKKNNKWLIEDPVRADVDEFALDNFLNSLVNLSAEKKLTVTTKDLSKFGLDRPYITIRFKVGNEWKTFKIGDKNPTGENYYCYLDGKNRVYLIETFQESSLDKKLFDLRDKRLFTLNRDKIDRIEIAQNDKIIKVLKESDNKWKCPDAPDVPIKTDKVDSLLDSLTWLRARKFVQETDDKLEDYGLKEPSTQVVLAVQKNKSQTLLIGKEKNKTERYAKIASRPGVVLISKSILNDLPKSVSDLEDKNILSFDTDNVGKIIVALNGKKYRLSREKEKWMFEGSEKSRKSPDTLEVNSLLWKLKDIEHQGKPANNGQKPVEGSISLVDKQGRFLGQVEWFGNEKAGKDAKPVVLVKKKEKERGVPYFIAGEDLKDLVDKVHRLLGDSTAKSDR